MNNKAKDQKDLFLTIGVAITPFIVERTASVRRITVDDIFPTIFLSYFFKETEIRIRFTSFFFPSFRLSFFVLLVVEGGNDAFWMAAVMEGGRTEVGK
jgi:hypothetical protein